MILDFISSSIALLKKILVLSLFICYLDAYSYKANAFWMTFKSNIFALQNDKLSLAEIKWETSGPDFHKEKPLIKSSLATFCNILFIPLEQSTNI